MSRDFISFTTAAKAITSDGVHSSSRYRSSQRGEYRPSYDATAIADAFLTSNISGSSFSLPSDIFQQGHIPASRTSLDEPTQVKGFRRRFLDFMERRLVAVTSQWKKGRRALRFARRGDRSSV